MGWRRTWSLAGVAFLSGGCTYWEPYPSPAPGLASPHLPSSLRAASDTGASLLLVEPFVRADTLFGRVGRDTVGLPLLYVRQMERQRVDGLRTLGLIVGVSAVWITAGLVGGGLE
jgi:hypothetical protein